MTSVQNAETNSGLLMIALLLDVYYLTFCLKSIAWIELIH